MLTSRTKYKTGWWEGVTEVEVDERKRMIKRYDGPRETAVKVLFYSISVLSFMLISSYSSIPELGEGCQIFTERPVCLFPMQKDVRELDKGISDIQVYRK